MAKAKKKRSVSSVWFIAVRGSYLPCSAEGWLIYLIFLLVAVMEVWFLVDLYVRQKAAFPMFGLLNYLMFLVLSYYYLTSIAKRHSK
jgi:hypothetical protein